MCHCNWGCRSFDCLWHHQPFILPSRDDPMRKEHAPGKGLCETPMGHSQKHLGEWLRKDHIKPTQNRRDSVLRWRCASRFAFICGRYSQKHVKPFIFDASKKQHHGRPGILFRIIDVEFVGVFLQWCFFFCSFCLTQGDSYNHLVNWLADARRRAFFFCTSVGCGSRYQVYRVCRGWKTTQLYHVV